MNKNEDLLIRPDENILDPKLDPIFKALFTSETYESKEALKDFLSAFTDQKVIEATLLPNEPSITQREEKQIRFDFSCKFNSGERATVEMALKHRPDELTRSEYYVSKLFISQESKGEDDYDKLMSAYQITLLAEGKFFDDNKTVHNFEYYDKENNISLDGKTRIITFEMSKLDKKTIPDNQKDNWGAFLKWANDKTKLEDINKIIESEGGIAMAAEALRGISLNEIMQIRAIEAEKKVKDYQSDMARSKREGIQIGEARGRQEGIREMALASLADGIEPSLISKWTNLSIDQITALRSQK
ncbi:MAG: PD-(D/E)XK nuclease family transposase [Candidatus Improbicoccus devescovinae]|nr:MAG: PD-(D/E)XK nuclease family transposase [Candidatus Improbicoccus devescovinae]